MFALFCLQYLEQCLINRGRSECVEWISEQWTQDQQHQSHLRTGLKCKFSGPHPRQTESETLRMGSYDCVITSPSSVSDACWSLRTIKLEECDLCGRQIDLSMIIINFLFKFPSAGETFLWVFLGYHLTFISSLFHTVFLLCQLYRISLLNTYLEFFENFNFLLVLWLFVD